VGTSEIDAFFTKNSIWYKLLQFHFHTPSEHSVDGFLYDAEIHFVHQRQTGARQRHRACGAHDSRVLCARPVCVRRPCSHAVKSSGVRGRGGCEPPAAAGG